MNLSNARSLVCFLGASSSLPFAGCKNPSIEAAEKERTSPAGTSPIVASSPGASASERVVPEPVAAKLPVLGDEWTPLVAGDTLTVHRRSTGGLVVFLARAFLKSHPVVLRRGPPVRTTTAQSQGCRVAINAGYFSGDQSMSLLASGGTVLTPGITELKRGDGTKRPVRGAMGFSAGKASARWAVAVSGRVVSFEEPRNASDPSHIGGTAWTADTIIGGGPVLVSQGQFRATYNEELFDTLSGISPTSRQPRTGVGFSEASGILYLVVSDGRRAGAAGHTLSEFAALFREMGANEAVNFDGGGSSAMTGEGLLLNVPSGGHERPVFSVLCVQ